jgi:hypothetical protein
LLCYLDKSVNPKSTSESQKHDQSNLWDIRIINHKPEILGVAFYPAMGPNGMAGNFGETLGVSSLKALDLTYICCFTVLATLWLFNMAMEHGPFIDDFPS